MDVLHRDDLSRGGFAGLREHRLIKDPRAFGSSANTDGSWAGLGNFIYLADANFMPHGETKMHKHREVDVISVIVEGRIAHKGSMGHGQDLDTNDVQVQRAGGEGFSHNEVNPDDEENRMLQLWVLPEQSGQAASYKVYNPEKGKVTRIYGGNYAEENDFPALTKIDIALLKQGQSIEINAPFIAYLTKGKGVINNIDILEGDLIRGNDFKFKAGEDVQMIVVHT